MEELIKILNIKEIVCCRLEFIDNYGNYKHVKIGYTPESPEKEENNIKIS